MKKKIYELWEEIFNDYDILNEIKSNGFFEITADQIRPYKEPRLMAKFDYYKQLPKIFKENNLGILPVSNGKYIIGNFNLFESLKKSSYENVIINEVSLPDFIETIDPDNIYSESNALNVAFLSGMFDDVFGEKMYETIQGKMRVKSFEFLINKNKVKVNGAAIEIDGGYESMTKVVLVEAKNSMPNDFVIRQLYYPYRYWHDKIVKEVIPVFFTYENGVYTFFIYKFSDLYDYNSLELIDVKRYIVSNAISENIKKNIFKNINLIDELSQKDIPLPQADSFSKVIASIDLFSNGICNANELSNELGFDVRQGKYYIDALRYLGIVEKSSTFGEYNLSVYGSKLTNYDVKERNKELISCIIKHKPFYDTYKYYNDNGTIPDKSYIMDIIKKYIPNMAFETVNRRASTIKSWIQWIIGAQV